MTLNAAQLLIQALVIDGGSTLLAIDETRLLHAGGVARREAAEANAVRAPTSIAVIPFVGPVWTRGQYGQEGFCARIGAAADNSDVGAIVIDVDSGGGAVAGTPEAAAAVRAAGTVKPVIAVVNSLAASAAYWTISGCTQIVVCPSAEVGGIGVLATHMDLSGMLESEGVKPTIIRSTAFKAEGNPFEPLSDAARDYIQASVDMAHGDFVKDVAIGRKTSVKAVNETFGQGRTVSAARAVSLGMADRVGTMADVLGGMRTKHAFRKRSALAFL